MNKNIKILLATVLTASASLFAGLSQGEYNRTALLFSNVNTFAENCYSRLRMAEGSDDRVGLCVGLMGYYMQAPGTRSAVEMGKGLGFNDTKLTIGHLALGGAATADIEVTFKADHRRAGADLMLSYALDNLYEGLYVGGRAGVLYERNVVTSTIKSPTLAVTDVASLLNGGALATPISGYSQVALSNLKVDSGKVLSNTGFNCVDLEAGLRVINTDNAQVCVRLVGTIPTASGMKNEYLFQPVAGNRNGKAGAGVCAFVKLLNDEAYALNFVGSAQWQFNFKREDALIPTHKTIAAAHYRMVAKDGMAKTNAVLPLANLLSGMKADIEPKSEVNALGKVSFEKNGLGVELGGQVFWGQERTITPKNFPTADKYYFVKAAPTFAGSPGAFANAADADVAANIVVGDFLTTYPSQFQGKVFGGVNYLFTEWDFPMMVGATASYTFATKRTVTPEYWGVSLKAGVSF